MKSTTVIANLIEYDDLGRQTRKPIRLFARLCTNAKPRQVLSIDLPSDGRKTRHRSIQITRAQLEKVLATTGDPT